MNNRRHQTLILLFCALASMSLALPHALAQAPSEKASRCVHSHRADSSKRLDR